MKNTDLAWAAGFVDGEGCIQIRVMGGYTYVISLSVGQVSPKPLKKLVEILGGEVKRYVHKRSSTGYQHVWVVYSDNAAAILRKLLPYLAFKDTQARLAIEFHENRSTLTMVQKDRAMAKMKQLKKVK